jgi:hypothetical protein
MESVFFTLSLIGILGVMYWAATNDSAGNRGPTKGWFAMRDFAAEGEETAATAAPVKPPKRR